MHTMKETTAKFLSDMRLVVIENHISELMYIISVKDVFRLVEYTNEFALKDACVIDTTNPVIYGVAMKHFVFSLFNEYETQERKHTFDVYLNHFIDSHWFEFVDTFGEFTRVNLDMIMSDADGEGGE